MPCAGIDNNDHIESFFDGISYQKGGAVLRMLRAWLTRRDDRAGAQPRLRCALCSLVRRVDTLRRPCF